MTRRKVRVPGEYPRCAVPRGTAYIDTGVVNERRRQINACVPVSHFDRMVVLAQRKGVTLAELLRRYVAAGLEAEGDWEGR